jgi:hypothetical protein
MLLSAIVKSDLQVLHDRLSVRPHETIWLPLEGFSLNLIP